MTASEGTAADRLRRAAAALETKARRLEAAQKDPTFPLGAEVKVRNDARAAYYTGQRGVVREHHMGEVGLRFGDSDATNAYFTRAELVRL